PATFCGGLTDVSLYALSLVGQVVPEFAPRGPPDFSPHRGIVGGPRRAGFPGADRLCNRPTAWAVQTADVTNDGKLEVLTVGRSAGPVSVALGNGNGTLSAPRSFAAGANARALAVADFNRDGKLDVVTANESGTLSLLKGNGDGTFQARTIVGISG